MRRILGVSFLVLLGLAAAEAVVRYSSMFPYFYLRLQAREGECNRKDYGLGIPLRSNCREHFRAYQEPRVSREFTISRNELGFRETPSGKRPGARRDVIFFGCSFVEGIGLADDETLPSQFARKMPGVNVENYGLSGAGPQHALVLLERPELFREARARATVGLFVFGSWQISRVTNGLAASCQWGQDFPRYQLKGAGQLLRVGEMGDVCPVPKFFSPLLGVSRLLGFVAKGIGRFPNAADMDLTAAIFAAERDKFRERFGSERFYVVLYPDSPQIVAEMKERLAARKVRTLDYSGTRPFPTLPDGHPSSQANEMIATRLANDLENEF